MNMWRIVNKFGSFKNGKWNNAWKVLLLSSNEWMLLGTIF